MREMHIGNFNHMRLDGACWHGGVHRAAGVVVAAAVCRAAESADAEWLQDEEEEYVEEYGERASQDEEADSPFSARIKAVAVSAVVGRAVQAEEKFRPDHRGLGTIFFLH